MIPATYRVTTTDAITGWEIQAHLGIVGTQAVAGTWFGSDWLASWSDAFGGRSGTYQRQLDALYSSALRELVQKAEMRGANWVVGVHVDFDEISGGGKQMFMVSLHGTAVRAAPIQAQVQSSEPTATAASADHVARLARRQTLRTLDQISAADDIAFLTEEVAAECAHQVAKGLASLQHQYALPDQGTRDAFLKYFRALPSAAAKDSLYPLLRLDGFKARGAAGVITDCGLTDYGKLEELLRGQEDFETRKLAVEMSRTSPLEFSPEDIPAMESLVRAMRERAFHTPPEIQRKTLLKGEYRVWQCLNGHDVALTLDKCDSCGASKDGYLASEASVTSVIAHLEAQVAALREVFATRPA
jgi:uncharacterized protein YbjQ (UPF0145 family)